MVSVNLNVRGEGEGEEFEFILSWVCIVNPLRVTRNPRWCDYKVVAVTAVARHVLGK